MKSDAFSDQSQAISSSLGGRLLLTVARFLTSLALSLWIGGMAFFGIMAAPVLFHPEKSGIERSANTAIIAPQMVSAMLTRFGTLTNICVVLLVVGCLLDGALSKSFKNGLWRTQVALILVCILFSQYLNIVLLPETRVQQALILPIIAKADRGEKLSPEEKQRRASFDTGHKGYQSLATLNLYLLMAVLFILMARSLPSTSNSKENASSAHV